MCQNEKKSRKIVKKFKSIGKTAKMEGKKEKL